MYPIEKKMSVDELNKRIKSLERNAKVMKRALITGITGFVGSHLAEYLLSNEVEVYGTVRWRSRTKNTQGIKNKPHLVEASIKNAHSMQTVIDETQPDYIFHLAAQYFVPTSWNASTETLITNIVGNVNLLEAVRKSRCDPVIQIAGSSEEYGLVYQDEVPIKETNPLRPMSPYGISKVAQDLLSMQYFRSYGLKTVVTRVFNHTGPRIGEVFVTFNFSRQITEIEKGKRDPIMYLVNLNKQRDF